MDAMTAAAGEFDYASLATDVRALVQQHTGEIRERVTQVAQNVFEIGERLLAVKAALPHGSFGPWLHAEFSWSESAALKMMQVATAFKNVTVTDLGIGAKALYLLAAPSTPPEVREEFVEKARAGEKVTHVEVKRAIRTRRERQTPPKRGSYDDTSSILDACQRIGGELDAVANCRPKQTMAIRTLDALREVAQRTTGMIAEIEGSRSTSAPTDGRRGRGIELAHEAINILMRIPVTDPLREGALATVGRWVEDNGPSDHHAVTDESQPAEAAEQHGDVVKAMAELRRVTDKPSSQLSRIDIMEAVDALGLALGKRQMAERRARKKLGKMLASNSPNLPDLRIAWKELQQAMGWFE